jgi:hypothetical protein
MGKHRAVHMYVLYPLTYGSGHVLENQHLRVGKLAGHPEGGPHELPGKLLGGLEEVGIFKEITESILSILEDRRDGATAVHEVSLVAKT